MLGPSSLNTIPYMMPLARPGLSPSTGSERPRRVPRGLQGRRRDEAKEEAQVTRLVTVAAGDLKARMEGDLAKVQEALAVAEEDKRRAEAKTSCLVVERMSLLLKLGVTMDEVSSLHS